MKSRKKAKPTPKNTHKANGRPSKFKTIDIEQLKFLVSKGCTDEEICQFFRIARSTFYLYQQNNKEFSDIIKGWKQFADDAMERSLYQRGMGYSHEAEEIFCAFGKVTRVKTIKHYPPETVAAIIWLKNRRPEVWRDNPPPAPDDRFEDAQLLFHGVPNQKDPRIEKEFAEFFQSN